MKRIALLVICIFSLIIADAFCMNIEAMMPVLDKAKKDIVTKFKSIDNDLAVAARELSSVDLKGEEARKILLGLCKNQAYLVDCAIVDTIGTMIVVEPAEYKKYEGSNLSKQEHIVALREYKKPVLSNVFDSVESIKTIVFAYPIFSKNGDFIGSISMLIKHDALVGSVVTPLVSEIPCKIWIMQKNGLIIYDPDPNQIGMNIFTDQFFRPFEDLIAFSRTVAISKQGAGSYNFYAKGLEDKTIVEKYVLWDTISLYGAEWRIVVMEADRQINKN